MYLVEVPDTDRSQSYENEDLQMQLVAALCGIPDFACKEVRMCHRVPHTKYVRKRKSDGKTFDKFIMWTFQGKLTDENLEELKQNEMFIDFFHDDEPVDLTTLWFEIPEQMNVEDDDGGSDSSD